MLLAIDTATSTASLALYDLAARQLLAELTWQARRRQTQDLLPALQDLLRLVDLTPAAITALAVTTGPGSFTGVRIAISAAKGMALGLPQPPRVVGIPTLSVTAAPYRRVSRHGGSHNLRRHPGRARPLQLGVVRGRRPPVPARRRGPSCRRPSPNLPPPLAAHTGVVWLAGELGARPAGCACGRSRAGPRRAASTRSAACAVRGSLPALPPCTWTAGTCDAIETLQPLYLRNP